MSSFFHTIVVFGASAALGGCGGKAVDSTGTGDRETGGAGSGGRGAGSAGQGGTVVFGSGGSVFAAGGSGPVFADAGGGWVPDLTTSQWACSFETCATDSANPELVPFAIDAACPVDPSRPQTERDCPPGTVFACDLARYRGIDVHVRCTCVGADPGGCGAQCNTSPTYPVYEGSAICTAGAQVCGCRYAYTGIAR